MASTSEQAALLRAQFDPEYLWSLDVGAKGEWLERRLYADVTAFYMKRTDMQVSTGVQLDPVGDPNSYFFYTDNASGGRNLGLESSVRWRLTSQIELGGTLGLLRTRYYGYRPTGEDLSARDQAHARRVSSVAQRDVATSARLDGARRCFRRRRLLLRRAAESDAQRLVRADQLKVGYEAERWSVYAWGRNVFDQRLRRARILLRQRAARRSRTSATCNSASRNSSESQPDGSFVDAHCNRDQPVPARCRLRSADQGVHRSPEHGIRSCR